MAKYNKPIALVVLFVALAFGSFQEKVKISVNNIIKYGASVENYNTISAENREIKITQIVANTPRNFYTHQSSISWFYNLTLPELSKLKWVNTLIFILVHLAFNIAILFLLFKDKNLLKILISSYGLLFIIAIGVYLLGKFTGLAQPGYNVARKIVGALQSQIPLMLFTIGYYLNKKSST